MNALSLNPFSEVAALGWRWYLILAGIVTNLCTSFRVEVLRALWDFTNGTGNAIKLALFRSNAALVGTYNAATTNYSNMTGNADEVANGNGYLTGGVALVNTTPVSNGGRGCTTPAASAQWAAATFTTSGCMGYNSTNGNRAWFVYDFGGDISIVAGTLTINMPANDSANALTRV